MRNALLALLCCLPALPVLAETMSHSGHMQSPAATSESTRQYNDINATMHENMAQPMTGDADVDFITGMIPHHDGAVAMARVVLAHGADPEVRKLAEAVIASQEAEVAWMKDWLATRDQPPGQ